MQPEGNRRDFEARLSRVLVYIYDHLDGDLSLDTLADIACMSRFHWHRVFRAMTGETLAEAIRRVRLLKAANALMSEDASIAEIAERHGYSNVASFTRAFTAAHGIPPGAFRSRGLQLVNDLQQNPGDGSMYTVTVQELSQSRAAGVAHKGPYAELGKAFQQLGAVIAARSLFSQVREMLAIYHDAPGSKPEADMLAHAAVVIAEGFPRDIESVEYFDIAGGKYAVLTHTGPYANLANAYQWLYGTWLPQSGEEPRDAPPLEVYVNDPRMTPPDQLRTEIRLPLVG